MDYKTQLYEELNQLKLKLSTDDGNIDECWGLLTNIENELNQFVFVPKTKIKKCIHQELAIKSVSNKREKAYWHMRFAINLTDNPVMDGDPEESEEKVFNDFEEYVEWWLGKDK